ncbi:MULTISPECIES: hypothetical protein [Ensifer]|uniref:hypothetical protein n=1 Tax=unclassified Ensifer TaxID=2633371 RepID=UPI001F46FD71|nr:hypothetical protein [Ensifer canadensis]
MVGDTRTPVGTEIDEAFGIQAHERTANAGATDLEMIGDRVFGLLGAGLQRVLQDGLRNNR